MLDSEQPQHEVNLSFYIIRSAKAELSLPRLRFGTPQN